MDKAEILKHYRHIQNNVLANTCKQCRKEIQNIMDYGAEVEEKDSDTIVTVYLKIDEGFK